VTSGPDLVVLGNLVVDDVVFPDGATRLGEPGGAVLYAALGASLWEHRVGCVSIRGADYPGEPLAELASRGVDLLGLHPLDGPGARSWLLYEGARRHIVPHLSRPSHVAVSPTWGHVPERWREARGFHVAPMPLEVQRDVVEGIAAGGSARVLVDPHVPLRDDTVEAWRDVLRHVDVLSVGPDEVELRGDEDEVGARLASLSSGRLRHVLWKQGARGGLLLDIHHGRTTRWSPGPWPVVDPTGAGDCFAAGFLAGLLAGEAPERALERGVVSSGLAMEGTGCAALVTAGRGEAGRRRETLLTG
jgi:sugar/nucleoside kinase (ribokinase family)